MTAWLRHHAASFLEAAARLAGSPLASALNVTVIGAVLALPLGGWMLLSGTQEFVAGLSADPQISVFLSPGASRADAGVIEAKLRADPEVRSVHFVGRAQALESLKRSPGIAELVATLKDNPLPDTVLATLGSGDPAVAARVASDARELPKVAYVQADSDWVRRAHGAIRFGRTLVALVAVLLAFALVAVTFNTIRLQVLTRRDEIILSKLIGATDSYIRRPFYYYGAMQAALGGLAAIIVVQVAARLLNRDLTSLEGVLGGSPWLNPPGVADSISFLAFSALVGVAGTYLSVSRHLRETVVPA